jgi:DNA-binding CsgD family transcriptional regulator
MPPIMPPIEPLATAVQLTKRERQVLALVARGQTNRQIGALLGIAPSTVKTYLGWIFAKTGAANRTEAAVYGVRCGVVLLDAQHVN